MSTNLKQVVTVGDRVRLEKGLAGTVQFVGEILQRKGIYYGIVLEAPKGKSDGQVGNIRYFQCKNKYGLFLRFSRIQQVIPNNTIHRIGVNDIVQIYIKNSQHIGVVRFIGVPSNCNEIYYGIEFENAISNNDGIFENIRYFTTKKNCAYFIKASSKYIHKIVYHKTTALVKTNNNNNNDNNNDNNNILKLPNTNMQIKATANKHNGINNGLYNDKHEEIELKIHFEIKDESFQIKILSNFSYNDLTRIISASGYVSNVFEIRFEPKTKQKDRRSIETKINLVFTQQQLDLLRLYSFKFYELGTFYIVDPLRNGIIFEEKEEFELALKTYEKALINNSKCIQLLLYYANCLILLERFDNAEEIYKKALNINPFCGEILYFYTRLLEYKQKYKEIEKLCDNISKYKNKNPSKQQHIYELINYKCSARLNKKYIELLLNRNKYISLNCKMETLQQQIIDKDRIIETKDKQLILAENEINLLKVKINSLQINKETHIEVPTFEYKQAEEEEEEEGE
eukprot:7031_1